MSVFLRWVELIPLDRPKFAIFAVLVSIVVITLSWVWNSAASEICQIDHFPNLFGIVLRAVIGFASKSRTFPATLNQIASLQVRFYTVSNLLNRIKQIALNRSVNVDKKRLRKFRALVGDDSSENVPSMFFIVESFRLCLYLLTHPLFPVSTVGAVLSKHSSEMLIPCTETTKLKFK